MALFDPKSKVISNCQRSIEEKKRSIDIYYDQIGRMYYDQYKNLTDVTSEINEKCDTVGQLFDEINDLELRIIFERGLKLCPNCKKENNLEYAFCFACGSKFTEESCTAPGTTASQKGEGKSEPVVTEAKDVIEASEAEQLPDMKVAEDVEEKAEEVIEAAEEKVEEVTEKSEETEEKVEEVVAEVADDASEEKSDSEDGKSDTEE